MEAIQLVATTVFRCSRYEPSKPEVLHLRWPQNIESGINLRFSKFVLLIGEGHSGYVYVRPPATKPLFQPDPGTGASVRAERVGSERATMNMDTTGAITRHLQ